MFDHFFCLSEVLLTSFPNSIYTFLPFQNSLFYKISSLSQSTTSAFHRSVVAVRYAKPFEERGFKRDLAVLLFTNVDGNATRVGTSTLFQREDDATGTLLDQMHNHFPVHDNGRDLNAICPAVILEEIKSQAYRYTVHTTK